MKNMESVAAQEFLTKKDVCALLKISPRTVDLWKKEQHLPFFKLGNVVRFEKPAVEAWFRSFRQSGGAE